MKIVLLFVGIVLLGGVSYFLFLSEPAEITGAVDSFVTCEAAGYFVVDTYPRQCQTPEGGVFFEEDPTQQGAVRQATPE